MKKTVTTALAATLLFGVSISPVMAQDNTANGNAADNDRAVVVDHDDDDGFEWGLLGLLGLLGLIPRKQKVVHHDTVRATNTTR
ncbi:WGxxGxxG family protein [Lysobacter xanthus]